MSNGSSAGDKALAAAGGLEKIGFVDFTVKLVQGVYEVITTSAMDQMKSYADFVTQISKSLEEYQNDAIGSDDTAKKRIADDYIKNVLGYSGNGPYSLDQEQADALKGQFGGITCQLAGDQNGKPIEECWTSTTANTPPYSLTLDVLENFVIQQLKSNAADSYNLLKTILKIGMQKVVVTNGEIHTKLTFHVDASETWSKTASTIQQKASGWGVGGSVSGGLGIAKKVFNAGLSGSISGGYSSSKLSVSVVNEKSATATNINIDILGEVIIHFRTETFPTVGL